MKPLQRHAYLQDPFHTEEIMKWHWWVGRGQNGLPLPAHHPTHGFRNNRMGMFTLGNVMLKVRYTRKNSDKYGVLKKQ